MVAGSYTESMEIEVFDPGDTHGAEGAKTGAFPHVTGHFSRSSEPTCLCMGFQ